MRGTGERSQRANARASVYGPSPQASDLALAADCAANLLASDMAYLEQKFPNFTANQLMQATAAAYNFGPGNIHGDPAKIDVGTNPNGNYGSNILGLMNRFPQNYCDDDVKTLA